MRAHRAVLIAATALAWVVVSCVVARPEDLPPHGWWEGNGPVVPHDTFPAECETCHVGPSWVELHEDFEFDHEAETGVALVGAHARAQCLRCHNDRGPVNVFTAKGCAGCHEDVHVGRLGPDCTSCHDEHTWHPNVDGGELHATTRFPLTGSHAMLSCRQCHVGAEIGRFDQAPTACVACHQDDLARAVNPPHITLGLVDRCDRCHRPTVWSDAD